MVVVPDGCAAASMKRKSERRPVGRRPLLTAVLVVLSGSEEPQLHVAGTAPPGPAGRSVPGYHR